LDEANLANFHARVKSDWQVGDIRKFKGEMTIPPRINKPGGRMDK
jgi:hypothetical protein